MFYNNTGAWRELLLLLPWVWVDKSNWEDKDKEILLRSFQKLTTSKNAQTLYEKWFSAVSGDYKWTEIIQNRWASDALWSKRFYENEQEHLLLVDSIIKRFIDKCTHKSVN